MILEKADKFVKKWMGSSGNLAWVEHSPSQ